MHNFLATFFGWNTSLFTEANTYSGHYVLLGDISVFVSLFVFYGLLAIVCLLPLVLAFKEKEKTHRLHFLKLWLLYLGTVSSTWILGIILKTITAVPRPYEAITTLHPLLTAGTNNSFPSLHSALAVAIASITSVWSRSLSDLLFVLALLIMLSRIIVGAHYPLDVVCGALLGFAVAHVSKRLYRKYS